MLPVFAEHEGSGEIACDGGLLFDFGNACGGHL